MFYIKLKGNWYLGDEWRGDITIMIIYTYVRYPLKCLQNNIGVIS